MHVAVINDFLLSKYRAFLYERIIDVRSHRDVGTIFQISQFPILPRSSTHALPVRACMRVTILLRLEDGIDTVIHTVVAIRDGMPILSLNINATSIN